MRSTLAVPSGAWPGGYRSVGTTTWQGITRVVRVWALPVAALVIGLGCRLYFAASFAGNFDQESYDIVTQIMLRGGNVYAETTRYNYSPAWAYVLLGLGHLSIWSGIEAHTLIRGFLTLVDLGVAALIGAVASEVRPGSGRIAFAAYMLNPVAILLVGYHGQFENLAILPLLAAMTLAGATARRGSGFVVWALGTASLIIKHLSVFSVWMLFAYRFPGRKHLLVMALAVLVFLLTFVPFLAGGAGGIVQNVFLYSSAPGFYGSGLLIRVADAIIRRVPILATHEPRLLGFAYNLTQLALPVFMGALPFVARDRLKLPLVVGMELSAVGLLASIYGISEQYFIIPVILGSILLSKPYFVYSAVTTFMLLGSPFNVHLIDLPRLLLGVPYLLWNLIWVAVLAWLIFDFRRYPSLTAPGATHLVSTQEPHVA